MVLVPARMLFAVAVLVAGMACTPKPNPAPSLPAAAMSDVSRAPAGEIAHLTGVRVDGRDGLDRLILEFADRVPGYTVGYRPLPAHADASGAEIALPGAGALLEIVLNPATAYGWGGGEQSYFGPSTVRGETASITEVKQAGDFEATLTWAVGVRAVVPFRVQVQDGPSRLIVELGP